MTGADNQQGSHRTTDDPSETRRRAPESSGEEIVRAVWRHTEVGRDDRPARTDVGSGLSAERAQCTSNRSERNSLSGKENLPRRSARSGRVPAHIGEALPTSVAGNPEGSRGTQCPIDPVTTDPKGEAGRGAAEARRRSDLQYAGPHQIQGSLWSKSSAGSLVRKRSHGGRRMLLHLFCPAEQAANRARSSSLVCTFAEREGFGAPTGSTDVLRMRVDPRVEVRSHLQV